MSDQVIAWLAIIPLYFGAAVVLLGVGTVVGLAARLPRFDTALAAPGLGVVALLVAGVVIRLIRLPWTPLTAGAVILAGSAVLGLLAQRVAHPREVATTRASWGAAMLGLSIAFVVTCGPIFLAIPGPESINQLPDTSFHVGAAVLLAKLESGSLLDVGLLNWTAPGFYPGGFQALAGTLVGWAGTSPITAANVVVLLCMGLIFPSSVMLLTRAVTPGTPVILASAGAVSSVFHAFPFWLAFAGPAWSNLLSTALIPLLLAQLAMAVSWIRGGWRGLIPIALVGVATACAIAGAQPNGLFGAALLGLPLLAAQVWAHRDALRWWRTAMVIVVALAVTLVLLAAAFPSSMIDTPMTGVGVSLRAAVLVGIKVGYGSFAVQLPVLLLQAVGVWYAIRIRAWWSLAGLIVVLGLWMLPTVLPTEFVRYLTWPWFNAMMRILALAAIPASVLVGLGGQAVANLGRGRGPVVSRTLGAAPLALVLVTGLALVPAKVQQLGWWYAPEREAEYFITPSEFSALRSLGEHVPPESSVALNPWFGGEFLFVASGRRPLFIQHKIPASNPQALLLGERLDQIALDQQVCSAAKALKVDFVLTGGREIDIPVEEAAKYRGIDAVVGVPGFQFVAAAGPYTLYSVPPCP